MKRLLGVFLCSALAVSLGCGEHKSTPGGPGATGSQTKSPKESTTTKETTAKEETFTLTAPGTTDIKQGQEKKVEIKINRGKNLKQDIKLTLTSDDKNVTVEPETAELKASSDAKTLEFTLKASKDAKIGEHKITVKGSAESGPPTETSFDVKVSGP